MAKKLEVTAKNDRPVGKPAVLGMGYNTDTTKEEVAMEIPTIICYRPARGDGFHPWAVFHDGVFLSGHHNLEDALSAYNDAVVNAEDFKRYFNMLHSRIITRLHSDT